MNKTALEWIEEPSRWRREFMYFECRSYSDWMPQPKPTSGKRPDGRTWDGMPKEES